MKDESDPSGIRFLRANLRAIDENRSDGETDEETRDRVFNILKYHARRYGKFRKLWRFLESL
jgi:hypothetical protein